MASAFQILIVLKPGGISPDSTRTCWEKWPSRAGGTPSAWHAEGPQRSLRFWGWLCAHTHVKETVGGCVSAHTRKFL